MPGLQISARLKRATIQPRPGRPHMFLRHTLVAPDQQVIVFIWFQLFLVDQFLLFFAGYSQVQVVALDGSTFLIKCPSRSVITMNIGSVTYATTVTANVLKAGCSYTDPAPVTMACNNRPICFIESVERSKILPLGTVTGCTEEKFALSMSYTCS